MGIPQEDKLEQQLKDIEQLYSERLIEIKASYPKLEYQDQCEQAFGTAVHEFIGKNKDDVHFLVKAKADEMEKSLKTIPENASPEEKANITISNNEILHNCGRDLKADFDKTLVDYQMKPFAEGKTPITQATLDNLVKFMEGVMGGKVTFDNNPRNLVIPSPNDKFTFDNYCGCSHIVYNTMAENDGIKIKR